jgi:hypothetical protein
VWMRGYLTKRRVILSASMTLTAFVLFNSWYQGLYRPTTVADSFSAYEDSRINFGRDHDLKAALYCELSDDTPIFEYRGQSILFYLTMYVPRSMWPDKPWPYAIYLTSHALERTPSNLGWGLTTSFIDEAVANFGLLGLFIGPAVFAFICRFCDRASDPLIKITGTLIACLLMSVEFVAFASLAFAWIAYIGYSRFVRGRGSRRRLMPADALLTARGNPELLFKDGYGIGGA